jgi:hypothetical protein
MTIPANQNNYISYTANGVSTSFAFNFIFFNAADLVVWVIDHVTGAITVMELDTDYTVTGGAGTTGSVIFSIAPTDLDTVFIFGSPANGQTRSFPLAGPLPSTEVEKALDRLTLLAQRLASQFAQCIRVPENDKATTLEVAKPATRASKALVFDGSGNVDLAAFPVTTAYSLTLLLAATAAEARTILGITTVNPSLVTEFAIAQGASGANVDGLSLDSSTYRAYRIAYDISRKTDSGGTEARETGYLVAIWSEEDGAWTLESDGVIQGERDPNVQFDMGGDQVTYTSSTISGSNYVGTFRYRVAEVF